MRLTRTSRSCRLITICCSWSSAPRLIHGKSGLDCSEQHRLALLTPEQKSALRDEPTQFWVDQALSNLYRPFGGSILSPWHDDPFNLFGEWAQARAQETTVRPRDGRLSISDDRREYVVLPFTLRVAAFSTAAQQAIVPLLQKAKHSARKAVPGVEVLSAGVILYAAAAAEQSTREVGTIGFGSMLGIIVMTWIAFRSLQADSLGDYFGGYRLPRRFIGLLGDFRSHPPTDPGIRRQSDRWRPGLWNLFSMQPIRRGCAST